MIRISTLVIPFRHAFYFVVLLFVELPIINNSMQGDMRQALNNLQSTHEGFGFVKSANVFKAILFSSPIFIAKRPQKMTCINPLQNLTLFAHRTCKEFHGVYLFHLIFIHMYIKTLQISQFICRFAMSRTLSSSRTCSHTAPRPTLTRPARLVCLLVGWCNI